MVFEHAHEYTSQRVVVCSVADKLGPRAETVRGWVRQVALNGT
jgi:transposase-like protein